MLAGKRSLTTIGNDFAPLFPEVAVKGKNGLDPQAAHGFESRAIHQTQVAAVSGENAVNGNFVLFFVHPFDFQKWKDIFLKFTHLFKAKPFSDDNYAFHDHIVVCLQCPVIFEKTSPANPSKTMIYIIHKK